MAKAKNLGVSSIGVYTLVGDSAVAETLASGATSATNVTAFYFPEARNAVVASDHGTQNYPRVYGPGKVLLSDLAPAQTGDFRFSSWTEKLVGINDPTPVTF